MTPAHQRPIETRKAFAFPDRVEVVEGLLAWRSADDAAGIAFKGGQDLLPEFLELRQAEPERMAAFLETYGIPEICGHGLPDGHRDSRRNARYCLSFPMLEDGRIAIASADIRRMARAFSAARTAASFLSISRLPDSSVWGEMAIVVSVLPHDWRADVDNWRAGRTMLAAWMTALLADCGINLTATWGEGGQAVLRIEPEADGLLGTLGLLLARTLDQRENYSCDVCGEPVQRVRAPQDGERVYCKKPLCKREQQRRNQAAWRAKKRAEKEATN